MKYLIANWKMNSIDIEEWFKGFNKFFREIKNDVELVVRFNCQRTKHGLLVLEAFISSKIKIKAVMLPKNNSLFETILVSINDKFVELFLSNKIKFTDISRKMNKMLSLYSFKKYKKIKPKNIEEIIKMNTKIKNDIEYFIKN